MENKYWMILIGIVLITSMIILGINNSKQKEIREKFNQDINLYSNVNFEELDKKIIECWKPLYVFLNNSDNLTCNNPQDCELKELKHKTLINEREICLLNIK